MTGPVDPQQPWWARPGGAPSPTAAPRPTYRPPPPPPPPPPTQYPPRQAQYPLQVPPRQVPHRQVPPRPAPAVDPYRYTLRPSEQSTPPRQTSRSAEPADRRPLLIAGLMLLAIVVLIAGVWQFAFRDTAVIGVQQAEQGVRQILSDPINGYGANTISALECNGGKDPSAAKGDSFTCAVEINGTVRQVYAEFQDDNGTFAVDGPR